MNHKLNTLPDHRLERLREQGFVGLSDVKLTSLAFGIRFAYWLCSFFLIIAIIAANVYLLILLMLIALATVILPYHPFDYIYNHSLRYKLGKPKLPPRGNQIKFSCGLAALWMGFTAFFFYHHMMGAGYLAGLSLIIVALTVSITDFCIPSQLYNIIFRFDTRKKRENVVKSKYPQS